MTVFFIKTNKMLRNLLIFSLCFVAIRATGEFSVLSSPKALSFKGNDALQSEFVGDVLAASLGNPIAGDCEWSGLHVVDPFNMPKAVIAVAIDGVSHLSLTSNAKTYELVGAQTDDSLNTAAAELESNNVPVCDFNFNQFDDAVNNYRTYFGDLSVISIKETKNLNPNENNSDKQLLQSIAIINSMAANLNTMDKKCDFITIRLSLASIAKTHGEKSEAAAEANKLTSAAVTNLNNAAQKSSNNEALFVVATNQEATVQRAKRAAVPPSATENTYNLAEYYDEDYPVIFNIILWFMVTFGLALLAICYAIGAMDPGRDSIIYRMTSTRMKKDN